MINKEKLCTLIQSIVLIICIVLLYKFFLSGMMHKDKEIINDGETFSPSDISLGLADMNLVAINSYENVNAVFNWYIIDSDTREAIFKGTYKKDNKFIYKFLSEGNYELVAYVWNKKTDVRTSKKIAKFNITNASSTEDIVLVDSSTSLLSNPKEYISSDLIEIYSFAPENIDVSLNNKQILCVNNYKEYEDLLYAWDILNSNGEVIEKMEYSTSNKMKYDFKQEGLYSIRAYIRINSADIDMRTSALVEGLEIKLQ